MNKNFSGNTGKIALHVLAWIILIVLPQYLGGRYWGKSNLFTWWFFVNTGTYLVIFYINYLLLVPRLYIRGNKLTYFISAFILIIGIYYLTEIANDTFFRIKRTEKIAELNDSTSVDTLRNVRGLRPNQERNFVIDSNRIADSSFSRARIDRFVNDSSLFADRDSMKFLSDHNNPDGFGGPPLPEGERRPRPPSEFRRLFQPFPFHIYNFALSALFFTFFSLGLKVMERHAIIEKKQKELEREKLNSELAFLKNQISPHFFFNTLNNIYSLIAINTEDSQEAVLKLSKLMRYLLYESEQGKTQISNEIGFMNNYIDLMRLRMSEKVLLSVQFPEEYENISIPPLLFIPFIENAFKHGISYREKSYIKISMVIERKKLTFKCSNSIGKKTDQEEEQHSGIGLDNVTKRLNLLFPEMHVLNIDKTQHDFNVFLEINLKQNIT